MLLKSSCEWMKLYKDNFIISDPDGWDRKNYDYSWNIEKIPLEEFKSRVMRSTIIFKTNKKGYFDIKK